MSKVHHEDVPDEVLKTLELWHGGQWSAVYKVMSSFGAGRDVEADLVEDAANELTASYNKKYDSRASSKELKALGSTIDWLEYAATNARKGQRAWENPSDKTMNAMFAAGGIAIGFGLLVWMVKAMGPKKDQTPSPTPLPSTKPISTTEPVLRVYQRYIENLDTQAMKCSEPQLVFEGSGRQALEKAWQLTTREPVGGKGVVAVAVPVNFPVTKDCNWRRVCYADGSCMGVVGLA
jgi:hypothetical protein